MSPDRPPDAVILPSAYLGDCGGDPAKIANKIKTEFDAILPVAVEGENPNGLAVRHLFGGQQYFVTRSIREVWGFPSNHPLHGQSQFSWTDRGDGVLYGSKIQQEEE